MFLNSQFIHPSVMLRTRAIDTIGYYSVDFPAAEDYAYFFLFVKHYQTANIPQFLIDYEVNPHGISLQKRKRQIASRLKVILRHFDFSFYAFYGVVRNALIYILPYRLIEALKKRKNR
jgi:hypothetical protein